MLAPTINVPTSDNSQFRLLLPQWRSDHPDEWYGLYTELNWDGLEADVYLAFIGSGPLQLSGFLVTSKSNINGVIAHCPVEIDTADPKRSYRNLRRQLQLARRIAQDPQKADQFDDAISLVRLIRDGRTVPRWVYALACIPLSYPTDGEFLYPTPFCPRLLSALTPPR
ncbi:MAG TPA: hypothetical protein VGQ99_22130 [Tepidisphaeraceae bacterium]|jgi:hypothetical protein|nr:hypothetical protein [Tepidisphaeraceae bacterium]